MNDPTTVFNQTSAPAWLVQIARSMLQRHEIPVQTDQFVIKKEIPFEIPIEWRNLIPCSACHEQPICA